MACEEMILVHIEAVEWLKKHYPALCEKSGLCERIGGRLYTRSALPAPVAAPPAQAAPSDAEIIESMQQRGWLYLNAEEKADIIAHTREMLARYGAQPAADEEILVNVADDDVYTLPLEPSGLTSGPRFVVHVPAAQAPSAKLVESVETISPPDSKVVVKQLHLTEEGREMLRGHLTKDERGEGINAARAAMQRTSGGDHE